MKYRLGVDVGGTFTDLVVVDTEDNIYSFKTDSTPADPAQALFTVLKKAAENLGYNINDFLRNTVLIVHGSTISTNAILTGRGAKTGLITTQGFRDALEIRRSHRDAGIYNLELGPPPPFVPRYLRKGITERTDKNGRTVVALDYSSVKDAIEVFKTAHVEAIAICLLFSFVNPMNEHRIEELLQSMYPDAYVSCSSDVLPIIREYERTSTTVLNAYVGPLYSRYISRTTTMLREREFNGRFLLMQSNGGLATPDLASRRAVNSILSGPAAAPASSALVAELHNLKSVITMDMGGTSTDICLLENRRSRVVKERMIGRYPLGLPMMDIHTIGTGGGAIARVNKGGLLQVGPESAGANPGPACYGKGGENATLTDCYLVLGYLNPDNFLGGEVKVDMGRARLAIERVAEKLRLDVPRAAYGIFALASSKIVDGLKTVSVKRGYDPRDFSLLLAGGAGPLHSCILALEINLKTVFVPKNSPVFCALGQIAADLKYMTGRTYLTQTKHANLQSLEQIYKELEQEAAVALGSKKKDLNFVRLAEMRYKDQMYEVDVEVPSGQITSATIDIIEERFHSRHEYLYTYREQETETDIVNVLLVATASLAPLKLRRQELAGKDPSAALKGKRSVYIDAESGYVTIPVYDGTKLRYGNEVQGPVIIEEIATTIPLLSGFRCSVDAWGNYVITCCT